MICYDAQGDPYYVDRENETLLCAVAQDNLTVGKMYNCAFYSEYIYEVYTDAKKWKHIKVWVDTAEPGDKKFKWKRCLVTKAEWREMQIDEILC